MFGLYEPSKELTSWCATTSYTEGLEKVRDSYAKGMFGEVMFICQTILNNKGEADQHNPDRMLLQLFLAGTMCEIDAAEARTQFESALPLAIEVFGETAEPVVDATLELALAYMAKHKYASILAAQPAKAEKLVKALLKKQETAIGSTDHLSLVPTLITLEQVYDQRKKTAEAQATNKRISKMQFCPFKNSLNEKRIAKGLTAECLANAAGCHSEYIDEMSDTEPPPSIDTLLRLARVLAVHTADFFQPTRTRN